MSDLAIGLLLSVALPVIGGLAIAWWLIKDLPRVDR
jgi:hypothetical protein